MCATSLLRPVLALFFVVNIATAIQWDYEFGHRRAFDEQIYEKEGEIGLFSYRNYITLNLPAEVEVTDVIVTVNSVSPAKVDYDVTSRTVSIIYSWAQITVSSYKITAYGYPLYSANGEKKTIIMGGGASA